MKIKKWIQKKYLSRYFVVYIISFVISHRILNWRCHWLTSKIVWFDTISCLGLSYDNVVTSKPRYVLVCTIGWAQWNLSCFEFKFDDTRLSSWYKNKIGPIKKNCCVLKLLCLCRVGCLSLAETAIRADTEKCQDSKK